MYLSILLAFLLPSLVFAQSGKGAMGCKEKNMATQKDYKCGQCEEPLIEKFDSFVEKVSKKSNTTLEEVLSELPEEMRTDVVFMGKSRSLQQGDRYLMKSPGSEIVASFNGHPENRGGKNVEVMRFNGKEGTFEFIDIEVKDGKAIVTKNPSKCMFCHGEAAQARPIFDPYRFWFNMVPSSGDTVTRGTSEEKDYLDFLARVENKDNKPEWKRYAHLKPMLAKNPIAKVKESLKTKGYWHVKSSPLVGNSTSSSTDGPGVRMFDEMYLNNHCRINNLLSQNPMFEATKYAIAASINGCIRAGDDTNAYIPEQFRNQIRNYYAKRNIVKLDSKDSAFDQVMQDTEKKQKAYFQDRVGRKLWMLEERMRKENPGISEEKAYQMARADIELTSKMASKNNSGNNAITDREQSVDVIGPIRYLMEPMGMDTSDLSISYDPGSYTFGDFISNMANFDPLRTLTKDSCNVLAEKSKNAFEAMNDQVSVTIETTCKNFRPYNKDLGDLVEISEKANKVALLKKREELRPKIKDMFNINDCSMCHYNNSPKGAPNYPFDSNEMEEFDEMMEKTAGELGDVRKRMWSRINRPGTAHGSMVPDGGLGAQERKDLKEYLETFTGTGRKSADKLKLDSGNGLITK